MQSALTLLEERKNALGIVHYEVSENNLERVLVSLLKLEREKSGEQYDRLRRRISSQWCVFCHCLLCWRKKSSHDDDDDVDLDGFMLDGSGSVESLSPPPPDAAAARKLPRSPSSTFSLSSKKKKTPVGAVAAEGSPWPTRQHRRMLSRATSLRRQAAEQSRLDSIIASPHHAVSKKARKEAKERRAAMPRSPSERSMSRASSRESVRASSGPRGRPTTPTPIAARQARFSFRRDGQHDN